MQRLDYNLIGKYLKIHFFSFFILKYYSCFQKVVAISPIIEVK